MDIAEIRDYLDDYEAAEPWLRGLRLIDARRAHADLLRLARAGVTLDLLAVICDQLAVYLPACADPDMALSNLERFVVSTRSPLATGALFQRDPDALSTLLPIFSTSQYLSELLTTDPEAFDLLRLTEGGPVSRQALAEDLIAEVEALEHDSAILGALRRFKHRETLRIAYGDIIRRQSLQTVTEQISYLADAVIDAATWAAWRKLRQDRGTPRRADGQTARFVVLGMGKLGGLELNYSSDVDLIYLHDGQGQTDGRRPVANEEFFNRLGREIVRLLSETTGSGQAYRVDLRLRPDGARGPMVPSVQSAQDYYENRGRTWERQAYIKARPVAGDQDLGVEFLERLRPWIYRRYLNRADITGIRALKRRIERRTRRAGADQREVKTGHGGIRDVEFVIQFLQLLNGGDLPQLQTGNTMEAIVRLEEVGCLSHSERTILAENYTFLRKIEHRLQIMFDLQTHLMPHRGDELRKLALRMGYSDTAEEKALEAFQADYQGNTMLNRRILDHLLHDAFGDEEETEAEVDLILDPDPPDERIAAVLGKYPFANPMLAYRNLMALAEEKIRFLSTRRCRHFLASIAPTLLRAIAETPDPDSTLVNLDKVSGSLGGKGVLWELFSFNPPSLGLYVRLCAYSPHLCGILTSNPGMIDGLMDGLVLDKLPSREYLLAAAAELCRGAEDLDPILHSFKNDHELRVGVRDVLGKENILATTRTLSDVAQACLTEAAGDQYRKLIEKLGQPRIDSGPRKGEPCEMVILAMGKFGGREMSHRSDLDIVFLYEAEGSTVHVSRSGRGQTTTNQHFFGELGQRIIKSMSRLSDHGRLYEIDARLRPTGRSGPLAVSLKTLARYFAEGKGQLWERQALCKARVVYGSPRATKAVGRVVSVAAFGQPWQAEHAGEIRQMRLRLEEGTADGDFKRGAGGIVDIEFLTQMLQLKHGPADPRLRKPNTAEALAALHKAGCMEAEDQQFFTEAYVFLRTLEGRSRLLGGTTRDRLPDDPIELAKLEDLVGAVSPRDLLTDYREYTQRVRQRFDEIFDAEAGR